MADTLTSSWLLNKERNDRPDGGAEGRRPRPDHDPAGRCAREIAAFFADSGDVDPAI